MPSGESQACQRKTLSACAITSHLLLVGLLMYAVMFMTLSWQDIIGEGRPCNLKDDSRSKATVVTDKAIMQKWDASTNFSEAWSNAEQNAREPAHEYMEKHHSTAIYMYSSIMLQPVKQDLETAESTGKQLKETFEARSLYSSLSEAIQILKHSKMRCHSTYYRTETLLHPNISNKLIRFSTFVLGSDGQNFARNASCFEVDTCFGADITRYSALKLNSQVLIPPYEVFEVKGTQTDRRRCKLCRCKIIYRLRSNLNCFYDRESDKLRSTFASPVYFFWLILAIMCTMVLCLLFPFVIVKLLEDNRKTAVCSTSSLQNCTYTAARAVI